MLLKWSVLPLGGRFLLLVLLSLSWLLCVWFASTMVKQLAGKTLQGDLEQNRRQGIFTRPV